MSPGPRAGRWVLVDAGPLYAMLDLDDEHHRRARAEAADLVERGMRLLIAYPTLFEAYSLIMRRLGTPTAQSWLDEIRRGSDTLAPRSGTYEAAAQRLATFDDQRISLFDALIAEIAEALELPVWTYDSDFDVMGVEVWRPESGSA